MIRRLLIALCLLPTLAWAVNYSTTVNTFSPNHYYRMDAASGTTETDIGSSATNGTYENILGTFTLNATGLIFGDTDKAVSTTGSRMYSVNAANTMPADTTGGGWSQLIWFKPTSGVTMGLSAKDSTASNRQMWDFGLTWNGSAFVPHWIMRDLTISCNGGTYKDATGGTLANNAIHMALLTTAGGGTGSNTLSRMTLYIDGVQVFQTTSFSGQMCPVSVNNDANYGVGCGTPGNQSGQGCGSPFIGTIDENATFTSELTAANDTTLYTAGIAPAAGSRWPFTVRRPDLPHFRNDDYFAQAVARGYNTGHFTFREIQPQLLNVGFPNFAVMPWGNVGH